MTEMNLLTVPVTIGERFMYSPWQELLFFSFCNQNLGDPFLRLDIENLKMGVDAKFKQFLKNVPELDEDEETTYDLLALFCYLNGSTNRNIWSKLRGRHLGDIEKLKEKLSHYLRLLNLPL